MKKILILLTAAAAVLGGVISCNPLQDIADSKGSIVGVVYVDGKPQPGVTVTITPGGGSYITKADGSYKFESLSQGEYTIHFTLKGYTDLKKAFNVRAGAITAGDVVLELDPNTLKVNETIMDFGTTEHSKTLTLTNVGSKNETFDITPNKSVQWMTLSETSGTIMSNGKASIAIEVDRSKVSGEKDGLTLDIHSGSGQRIAVEVNVTAGKPAKVKVDFVDIQSTYFEVHFGPSTNTSKYGFAVLEHSLNERHTIDEVYKYLEWINSAEEESFICYDLTPSTEHMLYVVAYNEYGQQSELDTYGIITLEKDQPKPSLEAFFGYWDGSAYDIDDKKTISWKNMSITECDFMETTGALIKGWIHGENMPNFISYGLYDETRKTLNLYGSWYNSYYYYRYGAETSNAFDCYAVFWPIFYNSTTGKYVYIENQNENDYPIVSLAINEDGSLRMTGGPKTDKNGNYGNGFVFEEWYLNDGNDDNDDVYYRKTHYYYNVKLTKAANPPVSTKSAAVLPVEAYSAMLSRPARGNK